jgi:flavodoxin
MNANTVIVYASKHHGNTKKLLEAIAEQEDAGLFMLYRSAATYADKAKKAGRSKNGVQ